MFVLIIGTPKAMSEFEIIEIYIIGWYASNIKPMRKKSYLIFCDFKRITCKSTIEKIIRVIFIWFGPICTTRNIPYF